MKDFTVSRLGPEGRERWHMYIGFTEKRSEDHTLINCFGCALLLLENNKECWFNYCFGHSPDWNEVTEMLLAPGKDYHLPSDQLCDVGGYIVNNIKEFIVRGN